jgi:uncharacterized protein YjhX (UPF0386 family)
VNKNDFEAKRQEIEGKLQRELGEGYKKIQVCDYFDNDGVHNSEAQLAVFKTLCQKEFEKTHTREEFLKIIGRNYL